MDPVEALGLTGNGDLRSLAEEVKSRLVRALDAVERQVSVSGTAAR
jgi:hypothetical protein